MSAVVIKSDGRGMQRKWCQKKRLQKGKEILRSHTPLSRFSRFDEQRMRKWRAENREKNRQNDLRCRVYRLARQKFGEHDSVEKQQFVRDEIARRLGRRMMLEQRAETPDTGSTNHHHATATSCQEQHYYPQQLVLPRRGRRMHHYHHHQHASDLPFYSAPQQKIELPSIDLHRPSFYRASSSLDSPTSPTMPHLSPSWRSERRVSSASTASSIASNDSYKAPSPSTTTTTADDDEELLAQNMSTDTLPSMHSLLSFTPNNATYPERPAAAATPNQPMPAVRYVEQTRILDEFVGVVLNYAEQPHCTKP